MLLARTISIHITQRTYHNLIPQFRNSHFVFIFFILLLGISTTISRLN